MVFGKTPEDAFLFGIPALFNLDFVDCSKEGQPTFFEQEVIVVVAKASTKHRLKKPIIFFIELFLK
jgi:hypothetical protein